MVLGPSSFYFLSVLSICLCVCLCVCSRSVSHHDLKYHIIGKHEFVFFIYLFKYCQELKWTDVYIFLNNFLHSIRSPGIITPHSFTRMLRWSADVVKESEDGRKSAVLEKPDDSPVPDDLAHSETGMWRYRYIYLTYKTCL